MKHTRLRNTALQTFTLLATLMVLSISTHASQTCHPLAVTTCAMPFPSNFYTRADNQSPTGLVIDLKGTLFSAEAEAQVQDLASPDIFAANHGFSVAAPIMLEVGQDFDNQSIPLDGGNSVKVFNLSTGAEVPIRPARYQYALDDRFAEKAHIIEIFPRSRFEFSQNYIALVTRDLTDNNGNAIAPVAGMTSLQQQPENYPQLAGSLDKIQQLGIDPNQVVTFTEFTTRDESNNNQGLFDLVDIVMADDHPVRNLKTTPINVWPYAASVKGQIRLSDFRQSNGKVDVNANDKTGDYWADFILMLPMASRHGSAPVSIYGHGLGTNKESMLLTVAYPNAQKGMASLVIDQPNHGSRADDDDGDIRSILNPQQLNRVAGMMTQSTLDMVSVARAIQTSLSDLNVVPGKNNWWNRTFYSSGLNSPDIDPERIHYQGTSMGGVLGTSFVAVAPQLNSAFLQVTGVGLSNILTHSTLFDSFGFKNMIPSKATAGEAALFMHALQQYVDQSDAINFAHYIRNPIRGRDARPLIVQYGLGDEVVFNRSTEVLAEIADLPLLNSRIKDVGHLRNVDDYEDGYGLVQTQPLIPTGGLLDRILAHASFIRIDSIQAMKRWIDQVVSD